ncbi:doublecortin domain-containing protein 2-like isoform X2 [Gigantopelta aegis]|uniref:doublecortin domain-containing protein 2-like isoform X2 n=1 Tax=Gigantopelta aegis TaxID=1735272 RepID=UPI001B88C081|nr:doublecortin domain-containing protein 2-like isoform X2 [Gigantopelta aegis]
MTTATMSTQSVETKNLEQAKHFNFYRNGDRYFPGRRYTWNRRAVRTFEAFLGEVTHCVKLQTGAVRKLYTPNGGHRVKDLSSMQDGGSYVAAGQDSFKPLEYTSIDPRPRNRKPINYNDVPPVYHCKRQVSGRIKRAQTQSIIIKCWSNGEDINEPHRILLTPWMQRDWNHVLNACTECLGSELNAAVHKLYTRDGYPVEKLEELEHGGRYVCVPTFRGFKRVDYKDTGMKNLLTSPRLDGRFRSLPPLSRDSKTSTNQSSPVHSQPASENGYPYTKRYRRNHHHQPKREEDSVFPAKPIAHKRSSERNKRTQEVNYDKDEGGVFKSKSRNNETKGAEEVKESRDTKVDLPIDQVTAEEVKDEDDYSSLHDESGIESANPPTEEYYEEENIHDNKVNGNNGRPDQARNTRNGAANNTAPQRNTVAKTNSKRNVQPAPKQQAKDEDRNDRTQNRNKPDKTQDRTQPDRTQNNSKPDRTQDRAQPDKTQDRNEDSRPEKKDSGKANQARKEEDRKQANAKRKEEEQKSKDAKGKPQTKKNGKPATKSAKDKEPEVDKNQDEAALTIQRHYRGYRSRQETKHQRETTRRTEREDEAQREERDLSPPRWEDRDSVQQRVKEEEAAIRIQAGVRGYQTRRRLRNEREQEQSIPPPREATPPSQRETTPPSPVKDSQSREDEAAAKIQAGYRGYRTRKELRGAGRKEEEGGRRSSTPLENNNVSKTYDREDLENQAAAKIQAGYRGYRVRKGMKA